MLVPDLLREQAARYELLDALPRNALGKVLKRELRGEVEA
jgi:acyl-CoA synthetase (AMP-forming)/AMP-acid ligase II